MDLTKLIPFLLKQASQGLTVTPEEVAIQLQKQEQTKVEDKDKETLDNDVIEGDERPSDDLKNEEGEMLEDSFKELEIEDAIEKAKEEKLLQSSDTTSSTTNGPGIKFASSYWEMLRTRIK